MASALGIDIAGIGDVDPMLSFSDEQTAVAESVIAVLSHEPGTLWWAPERGHNINRYLHVPVDEEEVALAIQSECEADERVTRADVSVTFDLQSKTITAQVKLTLTKNTGDVEFTLTVSEAGEVINASVN